MTTLTKQGIIDLLMTNDKAIGRALVALNERQTSDEQVDETTKYHNGRGFRPNHARKGTGMANFFARTGFLTEKQIAYWRKATRSGTPRIAIYAGQLLEVAERKAAEKVKK